MLKWRKIGITDGLTPRETFLVAAQFAGLAVAAMDGLSAKEHEEIIKLALGAMRTAYEGRMAVRRGYGRPVKDTLQ